MLRTLSAAVVLSSSLAVAQPASTPPAGGTPAAAPGAAATAPADAPVFARAETPKEAPESKGIRWGISGGVGTFLPGPLVSFGSEVRGGYQFNKMFAAYLALGGNGGFGFGVSASSTGASMSVGADSFWYVGVQGEVLLGDVFFVAAGPSLARGAWAFIGQGADINGNVSQVARAAGGWMPAVNAKIGFGFGKPNWTTGRRGQFTLAIDANFLFALDTVLASQSVNQGGVQQVVDTRGTAVGIAPVLMFGYDFR